MKKTAGRIASLCLVSGLGVFAIACGGSSGGDGGVSGDTALNIEGTLSAASAATARVLGAGEGGIAGMDVSALGDTDTTDEFGNFNLRVDGAAFAGGPAEFTVSGPGVSGSAVFDNVAGGAGATALIDLVVEDNGDITGTSSDAAGNVLDEIRGIGSCTQEGTFSDGGGGALWKPVSESTGTVVILMTSNYQNADINILDANGNDVASVIRTGCCNHNANRMHWWLNRSSSSLAGEALPLTVRFSFADGTIDCRTVPNPTQRYD